MDLIHTFANGLRLALCPMEHTRSVAIGVYVGAGAANESKDINGISHFTEHMLFKGTAKRTAFDIANEMESIGVQINAFTARHMTSYYTISTDEHTEHCMEMLSDIFFNSLLSEEEISRERNVILEEISRDEDDPEDVCNEGLACVFYGDTPMGRPILGSRENVKRFNSQDIRNYMQKYYVPQNTIISMAGSFKVEDAIKLASKYFEHNFKNNKFNHVEDEVQTHSAYFEKVKPTEQANIAFAFPAFSYKSEERDVVSLVSSIFGGGMSSRLFQNVRERRGLAYDVYSIISADKKSGAFTIYVGTNPKTALQATEAIKEEIDKLIKEGITEQEFNKGLQQLKTNLVLGSESSLSLMRANGRNMIMTGEMFSVDAKLKNINAITQEKVNEVVAKIFNYDNVAASYVGPQPVGNVYGAIKGGNND
ncbi:MAG: insulinase family protein [Clostridia bacterium]|nr:insulinase family protein [Clostridia bacterium]